MVKPKGKIAMTDYGHGITSEKGKLTINGRDYKTLGYEDTVDAYNHLISWRDSRGLTTKNSRAEVEKLKAQVDSLYPAYMQEQAQAQFAEYTAAMTQALGTMAKTMSTVEDAKEPLKQAADNYSAAQEDVKRRQNLRNGLLSLYTRYGNGVFTPSSTGSKATILGG